MTMPWTMGALLPAEQRYTNLKFRRVARQFVASRLDYVDAAELCAFMDAIGGVKYAKWIFHWKAMGVREAEALLKHLSQFEDHAVRVAENVAVPTRDDGLKCLRAMQDGGWRVGSVPPIVRLALLDMKDSGMTIPAIGAAVGLTKDQVNNVTGGIRAYHHRGRAGLAASAQFASSFYGES